MYPKKIATQKVKEQLKQIYGDNYICEYVERYGGKLIYPITIDEASRRLIGGDFHRVVVDSIAKREKNNPTFELITPELFKKYGEDLEIVSESLGCTTKLRFNENGKLISYI